MKLHQSFQAIVTNMIARSQVGLMQFKSTQRVPIKIAK